MARARRIMVRLSLPMSVSLDTLCERQGMSPATMAFVLLRQALARTMDTPEVKKRVAEESANLTTRAWREQQYDAALELAAQTEGAAS